MAVTAFRKLRTKFDWPLFGAILAIVTIGLVNLYSATRVAPKGLYQNQLVWFAVGGVLFLYEGDSTETVGEAGRRAQLRIISIGETLHAQIGEEG